MPPAPRWRNRPAPPPSLSAWVWAFGATPIGVDLAHHNVFFTADPELEFGPIGAGEMPEEPTLYICAQDREMQAPVPEIERFEIIMNGPAGHQPFPQEEAQCRARTFPMLAAMGLTFSPDPETRALTTPALLSRRFPGSLGAIYGGSPEGTLATFRRPLARTGLKGLYLAGGGTHPGAGVPMALTSGTHAARALLADRISAAK
ncbi:phytoene desaturase family protein [Rhodobacter capsulatus]|uniref:phytoene desaturase family protein n=1 Tax=Rhodobacter capsulatus TaxID=1061 RepID=UPI00403867FC